MNGVEQSDSIPAKKKWSRLSRDGALRQLSGCREWLIWSKYPSSFIGGIQKSGWGLSWGYNHEVPAFCAPTQRKSGRTTASDLVGAALREGYRFVSSRPMFITAFISLVSRN